MVISEWADRGDFRVFAMDFAASGLTMDVRGLRRATQAAAWLDLSARGRLRVTGEDRARLLHAMTTNQVQV